MTVNVGWHAQVGRVNSCSTVIRVMLLAQHAGRKCTSDVRCSGMFDLEIMAGYWWCHAKNPPSGAL